MKNLFLIIFALLFNLLSAQVSDFTMGVTVHDTNSSLGNKGKTKLETKLINLLSKSDSFTYGYNNDFVLSPIIDVVDSELVQTGLENLAITKVEITFVIKQFSTNKIYGSKTKIYKGSGKVESEAVKNSFSKIKASDKSLHTFFKETKEKIFKYYSENCSQIISDANNIASKGDYERSISLLQSIPNTGSNCYNEAQKTAINHYKRYQKKLCANNISKAQAEIALNNFDKANYYLSVIDSESECSSKVENLVKQISNKVTKQQNDILDLETKRIDAIKEIGKAYYSNQIHFVN